jgi:hypothetical protein
MRYIISGFVVGALISLFLFTGEPATEIYETFFSKISSFDFAQSNPSLKEVIVVPYGKIFYLVSPQGELFKKFDATPDVYEFSAKGDYYIKYGYTGKSIELNSSKGERFWNLLSREKPLISYNGKMIFLLNGDHSKIRIIDINGNVLGVGEISGRLFTTIEFSELSDFGACGFADGSYWFIDENGNVINKGNTPAGNVVKGMKVSSRGKFGLVHYGNADADFLRVVNLEKKKWSDTKLGSAHHMKTALAIDDRGFAACIDLKKFIVVDDDADEVFSVAIPEKKAGQSSLSLIGNYFFLCYTKMTGGSQIFVFDTKGRLFFQREFSAESFLNSYVRGDYVVVRGSDSLFSYRFHFPEN